jgi:hypothetical protein
LIGGSSLSSKVYLHIGVAKTGTTYLQRVLYTHRDALRGAGLLYPGTAPGDHYIASLDVRGMDDPKFDHLAAAGMWDQIADEMRRFDGNSVISHETFARCSRIEIKRMLASLADADVRVVLTVRDLGRQIPAVWQETLKNKAGNSYEEFLGEVFVDVESGGHKFFWKPQNVAKVVRRWERRVGADHITVVTVPPSGAPRDELWNRFAKAIELPDIEITFPDATANSSIGPAQAELLRHLNMSLPPDLPWPRYTKVVKRQFAEVRLARHSTQRILVPPAWHDATRARAAEINGYLAASGVRIVGDLADLEPALPESDVSGPDDLSRDELMQAAAEVVRELIFAPPSLRKPPRDPAVAAFRLDVRFRGWLARMRRRMSRG